MTNEVSSTESRERAACCPQCGAPLGIAWTPIATAGAADAIPPGIKGWSWGAFLLNIIWAIGNRTWIGLLMIVPYLCFVMPFVLGYKGREWAWKNRRWESVEQFQRVQRRWTIDGFVVAGIVIGLGYIAVPAYRDINLHSQLVKVESAMDPVKLAAAKAYREQRPFPAMHTIVTAANQGKLATGDWAALGFKTFPVLPPQIKRLEFSGQDSPEIVVELDKIGESLDGTTVRAKLITVDGKLFWQHEVTASTPMAARFFHSYDGAAREPPAPGHEAMCPP